MRRGEIWLVAGGVYASKPRPAIVVQDDRFDTDSVTVCPLTTTVLDAPLLRLPVPSDEVTGIERASYAMVDKLTTIRRSNATERVGHVAPALMVELERRIAVFLGLAG